MEAAMAPAPPAQAMQALAKANRTRTERANLKRQLRAGEIRPREMLEAEVCGRMRVWDMLLALPRYGPQRAGRVVRTIGVSPSRTLESLTERQQDELVSVLG